ncbi:hypothetical protein JXB41_05985 [Candidatus Woesearchaeota archaeon]|nr:hypothetical protein [Candidatus Woesearchaeota archaeon]
MMFKKKAVSPLIATVLLVLIVVSIGAAVMLVLKGLTVESMEEIDKKRVELKCTDVNIEIFKIGDDFEICHDSGSRIIKTIIINKGTIYTKDLKLTAIGASEIYNNDSLSIDFKPGEIRYINLSYGAGIGDLKQIKIIPVIAGAYEGEGLVCSESAISWAAQNMAECE